jgi:hypothetical protein
MAPQLQQLNDDFHTMEKYGVSNTHEQEHVEAVKELRAARAEAVVKALVKPLRAPKKIAAKSSSTTSSSSAISSANTSAISTTTVASESLTHSTIPSTTMAQKPKVGDNVWVDGQAGVVTKSVRRFRVKLSDGSTRWKSEDDLAQALPAPAPPPAEPVKSYTIPTVTTTTLPPLAEMTTSRKGTSSANSCAIEEVEGAEHSDEEYFVQG